MSFSRNFEKKTQNPVSYGTAGYRTKHEIIKDIVRRAYLFCLIRSSSTERPVGLILTASHNPSEDNGIKYIDYTGNMLSEKDEAESDRIVNGEIEFLEKEFEKCRSKKSTVIISRDTRESGEEMVRLCVEASKYLGETHTLIDMGILSTPQSHFIVREIYTQGIKNSENEKLTSSLLNGIIDTYYHRIESMGHIIKRVFGEETKQKRVLDSSNGVGLKMFSRIKEAVGSVCDMYLLKNSKDLNEECGSDYIKSKKQLPAGVYKKESQKELEGQSVQIDTTSGVLEENTLISAFDGDADRIIYLKPNTGQMIDGDRLCVLFSSFLNHLLLISGIKSEITSVVTDYTNGAAVNVLKTKGPVKVAGTGVKNMQKASNNPITVWFESNGHGTVCFSEEIHALVRDKLGYTDKEPLLDKDAQSLSKEIDRLLCRPSSTLSTKETSRSSPYNELFRRLSEQEALLILHSMCTLFDPYIGDALTNMFVSECIFYSGFILSDVLLGIYQDMPNLLTSVKGRRERLNELIIESIKAAYSDIRVHLRASGTEDIIRIYVEGESEERLMEALTSIESTLSEL